MSGFNELQWMNLQNHQDAHQLLRWLAFDTAPIMRSRGWRVQVLREFLPHDPCLLGLNVNHTESISLRLRYTEKPHRFIPVETILDAILHELAHIVHGNHGPKFHNLWDELRQEYYYLQCRPLARTYSLTGARPKTSKYSMRVPPSPRRQRGVFAHQQAPPKSREERYKEYAATALAVPKTKPVSVISLLFGRKPKKAPVSSTDSPVQANVADDFYRKWTRCNDFQDSAGSSSEERMDPRLYKSSAAYSPEASPVEPVPARRQTTRSGPTQRSHSSTGRRNSAPSMPRPAFRPSSSSQSSGQNIFWKCGRCSESNPHSCSICAACRLPRQAQPGFPPPPMYRPGPMPMNRPPEMEHYRPGPIPPHGYAGSSQIPASYPAFHPGMKQPRYGVRPRSGYAEYGSRPRPVTTMHVYEV